MVVLGTCESRALQNQLPDTMKTIKESLIECGECNLLIVDGDGDHVLWVTEERIIDYGGNRPTKKGTISTFKKGLEKMGLQIKECTHQDCYVLNLIYIDL